MKHVVLLLLLSFVSLSFAATRKIPEKVLKFDTTIVSDTIVSIDTLQITKSYNDTSLYVKSDTLVRYSPRFTRSRRLVTPVSKDSLEPKKLEVKKPEIKIEKK
jgi:hypothetical protein